MNYTESVEKAIYNSGLAVALINHKGQLGIAGSKEDCRGVLAEMMHTVSALHFTTLTQFDEKTCVAPVRPVSNVLIFFPAIVFGD